MAEPADIIDKNKLYLVDHIQLKNTPLWERLIELGVFNSRDVEEIKEKKPSQRDQVRELLHVVSSGAFSCYQNLRLALGDTNQGFIVEKCLPQIHVINMVSLVPLEPPVMELDLLVQNPELCRYKQFYDFFLAPLQDSGALLATRLDEKWQVLKVDPLGQLAKPRFTCKEKSNIIVLITDHIRQFVYIIQANGRITKCDIEDMSCCNAAGSYELVIQGGVDRSMINGGVFIGPDELMLPDRGKGEVFSYYMERDEKKVHLKGLNTPLCVSYNGEIENKRFAVSERRRVTLYDNSWNRLVHISNDKQYPNSMAFSPTGSLYIVSHMDFVGNHDKNCACGVGEYNEEGSFVRNVIMKEDGLGKPYAIAYCHPYLWVKTTCELGLKRFKIYSTVE